MSDKISNIYSFLVLKENREFNRELQTYFYKSVFLPHTDVQDKTISLLYHIANTQSQPKINDLADFFEHIITNKKKLIEFNGLLEVLEKSSSTKDKNQTLFSLLEGQKGWGPKTAALFTKCIFQIHSNDHYSAFKLWDKLDLNKFNGDKGIMLPVDSVITFIFEKLKSKIGFDKAVNFNNINDFLRGPYPAAKMEVWDDLWFWGYFTQKIEKETNESNRTKRVLMWNKEKYWANPYTDKNIDKIQIIEMKAKEFINLIQKN